jgi:hypothetical protein
VHPPASPWIHSEQQTDGVHGQTDPTSQSIGAEGGADQPVLTACEILAAWPTPVCPSRRAAHDGVGDVVARAPVMTRRR